MSGIPRLLIPKEYERPWLSPVELYDLQVLVMRDDLKNVISSGDIQNLRRAIYELVNRQREQFTNEFNDWVR